MMRRTISCFVAAAALLAVAAPRVATAEDAPSMFFIIKEDVEMAKTQDYEAAIKNMIAQMHAYEIDPAEVNFKTVFSPEMGYVYVIPIEGFAGMEKVHSAWEVAKEKIGLEKWEALEGAATKHVNDYSAFHGIRRNDLSFLPDSSAPPGGNVIHYTHLYTVPGKQKEFEAMALKYQAMYKKHDVKQPWVMYEVITGPDLPHYVVAHPCNTVAEYFTNQEKNRTMFGEEGQKLSMESAKLIRRVEENTGFIRPDLSYPGPGGN